MKAYTITCKDMGMDCPFSITTGDKEETKKMAMMHAQEKHADMMNKMSDEEKKKMSDKMDSMMHESDM